MRKLEITEMHRLSVGQFKEASKLPVAVLLDNVRSLHNIGAVFRTADAFRIEKLCLCGITGTPPSAEIHKTALGAEDSVAWQYFADSMDAARNLKDEGFVLAALEQAEGSVMLDAWQPDTLVKYALVIGNEVHGVDQRLVDMCDVCLEIPQEGTKHSLNVSVATGIALWDFFKCFCGRI